MPDLTVRCQCGAASQTVRLRHETPLTLCHCETCRHSTGLLCTSYYPVEAFATSDSLRLFRISSQQDAFFCGICGCHVARCERSPDGHVSWSVATGTVVNSTGDLDLVYGSHQHVAGTKDGGISPWIDLPGRRPSADGQGTDDELEPTEPEYARPSDDLLHASCACGAVSLHISRPNAASRKPHRWLPDLMVPFKTTPDSIKSNPSNIKWWIPNDGPKYLAGTCACQSCRLASGFEIQTWAFVPRCNISIRVPEATHGDGRVSQPLDFSALPQGILQSYSSSANVVRDFCGTCGATVFWRAKGRPDVIDVSVGLLRAPEGARAENWLEWWTERVSFSEDAGVGRVGDAARAAVKLIQALEDGLESWEAQH